MSGARLTSTDLERFLADLQGELQPSLTPPDAPVLQRGPSLAAKGCRLWLTLLDDATPGQLRVRKLNLAIFEDWRSPQGARPAGPARAREWYSTSPVADRWQEFTQPGDEEWDSASVLEMVRAEFLAAVSAAGSQPSPVPAGKPQ